MTATDNTSNAKRPCACGVQGPHYPRPLGDTADGGATSGPAEAAAAKLAAQVQSGVVDAKRIFRALGVPYTPDTDPQDYDMEGGVTAAAIEKEAEPPAYTAEDFARAEFARHPDGRIAARIGVGIAWYGRLSANQEYLVWRPDELMASEGWVPVQESRASVADAALAQMAKDFRVVRAQRDDAGKRARKAEKERNDAQYGMEVATQQRNNWESIARQAIAEQPRPLTPDEITDRFIDDVHQDYFWCTDERVRLDKSALRHALLDAIKRSSRPEGADQLEAWLDGLPESIRLESDEQGRAVADYLAARGVRVMGADR